MFSLLNQFFAMVLVVTATAAAATQPAGVMLTFDALSTPAATTRSGGAPPILAETKRDKTGTSTIPKNTSGSQTAKNKPNASRGSFLAEGKGFEPSTGFPAPDFESSGYCTLTFRYPAIAGFFSLNENVVESEIRGRCTH